MGNVKVFKFGNKLIICGAANILFGAVFLTILLINAYSLHKNNQDIRALISVLLGFLMFYLQIYSGVYKLKMKYRTRHIKVSDETIWFGEEKIQKDEIESIKSPTYNNYIQIKRTHGKPYTISQEMLDKDSIKELKALLTKF